jgi:sugar/nucleoside kinase (ribokinase family)
MPRPSSHQGLFVGLTTLDSIYRAPAAPTANQKIVATAVTFAAGGPATNAAIAFQRLGNYSTVVGAVGRHPIAELLYADLAEWGVELADLTPERSVPPPLSSIVVTESTGDRAVVSLNATQLQVDGTAVSSTLLNSVDILLLDGHQMAVSLTLARQAKQQGIPIVIDAGSWKTGFESVLALADYVIASAQFLPPGCQSEADVLAYFYQLGIPHYAISRGGDPLVAVSEACGRSEAERVVLQVPPPPIKAFDTLGAGDFLHGAFCHFILQQSFPSALKAAIEIASYTCQFFGTREWMFRVIPERFL